MPQATTAPSTHPKPHPGLSASPADAELSTRQAHFAPAKERNLLIPNHHQASTSALPRSHRTLASLRALDHLRTRGAHLRARTERGAATAEYAITIVGACAVGGVLVSLLKSSGMLNALKSIINYGLKMAGVEGVQL